MNWAEIEESATQVWTRQGTKNVRKYRCTAGSRKGRVVSKPSTCTAPKNIKASNTLKKTKGRLASSVRVKTKRTKKYNPASIRLRSLTKRRKPSRRKNNKRKKI
jgi:hypothetical protein